LGVSDSRGSRRKLGNKILVAIAAQIDGKGIGRIHLRRIPAASASPLVAFVEQAVKPGSVVITDGCDIYTGLTQKGFNYRPRAINASSKLSPIVLPRVYRVASLFKRWLIGTHQGALSHEQLDTYLEEFTFLFNRRTSKYRWKQFSRLVAQAVSVEPVHFPKLIAGSS
jgi:transposase-like protein